MEKYLSMSLISNLIGNSAGQASRHRAARVNMCLFLFQDHKQIEWNPL